MDESSVYNESDLAPFRRRLNDLRTIIKTDSENGKHPVAMTKLLERQHWDSGVFPISSRPPLLASHHTLESVLNRMQDNLSVLCDELLPLHERLVTIRRKLVGLAAKGGLVKAELKPLQEELRKIDSLSTIHFCLKVECSCSIFAFVTNFLPLDTFHTRKQHVGNVSTESSLAQAAVFPRHKPSVPHFWKNALISFRRFVPRKNQSMSPHRSSPFMTASPGSVRSLRALR
jgi:hypothetical protein